MIPAFPSFKSLELADRQYFDHCKEGLKPYSDTNFNSLWSWDVNSVVRISLSNDNIVILMQDYDSEQVFLTILGTNAPDDTLPAAYDFVSKSIENLQVKCISKEFAEMLSPEKWQIRDERDSFDYILSIDKLVSMPQWKNSSIAANIQKFKRQYDGYTSEIRANTKLDWQPYLELFKLWCSNENIDLDINHEWQAFQRFSLLKDQNLITFSLLVNNQLVAFECCELIGKDYVMSHFCKADKALKGVFDIFQWEVAKQLQAMGFEFINIEQDLGLLNLRYAKSKYLPVDFLIKYCVYPRF